VVVDAAAPLPPVENLWRFTGEMRADLALFFGGKGLLGRQSISVAMRTICSASCGNLHRASLRSAPTFYITPDTLAREKRFASQPSVQS